MPEVLPGTVQEAEERPESHLEPGYLVICWNDPVNFMDYVTLVFQKVFGWPRKKAEFHMLQVHEQGKSVLTRESLEKAEHYVHQLQKLQPARHDGARRVKLTRVVQDTFRLELGRRERAGLLELLHLYPCVPPTYLSISKSGNLPDKTASQKLLDEALADHRAENQRLLQNLLGDPTRWTEMRDGFHLRLSGSEIDWILQILNDIRVGSWIALGSPEKPVEVINAQTAPRLWALELAGFFQMHLIHALEAEP